MKKVISLISVLVDSHFGISTKKYAYFTKKQRLWEPIVIGGSILVVIVALYPLYHLLMRSMMDQYLQLGLENLFITTSVLLTGFLGFFFGIFFMVNALFFSKDMRVLVPLPLSPSEVITGKMFIVFLDQMFISLALLMPPLIYFGVRTGAGIHYWLYAAVVFLLSQVIPVTFIGLILLPLSRYIKINRYRDFLVFFISAILLVGVLVLVGVMGRMEDSDLTSEGLTRALADPDALISRVSVIYPPGLIAVRALTTGAATGSLWTALYVLMNFGAFALLIFLGKKLYYHTYTELQESYASRKQFKEGELAVFLTKQETPLKALVRREWRYFLRVPSFAVNGLSSVVIFPVLLLIMTGASGSDQVQQILGILEGARDFIVPAGILVAILAGSLSTLASSAFSREGKLFRELKALPVSVKQVLMAKIAQITTVSLIGPAATVIALFVLFRISLLEIIAIVLTSMACITFLNFIQFLIDVSRPVLDWDNPHKAMKQNLNVAFSLPVVFGFVIGAGYLGYRLSDLLPPLVMTLILLATGVFGTMLLWRVVLSRTNALFMKDL